jgi:hypothetical protein
MFVTSYLGTRSPCRLKGKEAHPWLDEPFHETVVLLDQVIEVFDADVSSTCSERIPAALSSAMALGEAAFFST